ncbi:MAG: hypothetical protein J5911_03875 [Clostridia bacterium]|nr:hypothetical protein [Clostridia bacterium]
MQNKTLLAKIIGLVMVVCLALTMAVGLVGCGDPTVKSLKQNGNVLTIELTDGTTSDITLSGVKDAKVDDGKLVFTYLNGDSKDLPLDVASISSEVNEDGSTTLKLTFDNGTTSSVTLDKVVKDVALEGDTLSITYSDDTTDDITLAGVKDVAVVEGEIVVTYMDGETATLPAIGFGFDTAITEEGDTEITIDFNGASYPIVLPKVVEDITFNGNQIVVTYTNGTQIEYGVDGVVDVNELDNGQTEIIYADGSVVTIGDADCDHDFGDLTVIKPASCCEEGFAIMACSECGYVQFVEIEKDPEVHGKWVIEPEIVEGEIELTVNNNTISYSRYDTGTFAYKLVTEYEYGTLTIAEGYSGVYENCFEATCALCGEKFASGHADPEDFEPIPLVDPTVNICEDQHKVYYICPICHAALLYDEDGVIVTEKEAARGHLYGEPVVGDKFGEGEDAYYKLFFTCQRCGKEIVVNAYWQEKVYVGADCRNDGYSYNVYSYVLEGEEKPIKLDYEEEINTGLHTVVDGVLFRAYSIAEPVNIEFTEDLKPLFESGLIRWSEGEAANCSSHVPAVFTCTVCGEVIVISLSGEHTFGAEVVVPATCTEDGYSYKECADCDYRWVYNEVEATGHDYRYVSGLINQTNGFQGFRCAKCSDVIYVEPELVDQKPAEDCKSKAYDVYRAEVPVIDNETKFIEWKVESADGVLYHTVKKNTATEQYMKYAAYNLAQQGPNYEYNGQLKQFFADGVVAWNEGEPANCSSYALAVFTCKVCDEQIVISLSGEHLGLDQNNVVLEGPFCTERGEKYVYCADCQQYVLQETYDAVGHNFVVDAESWDAFTADPTDGAEVIFNCTECDEEITLYADETITVSDQGCVTVTTWTYNFFKDENGNVYKYVVEAAEEGYYNELTFKPNAYTFAENEGAHKIGVYNGQDVKVVAFNLAVPEDNKYEYQDKFDFFFEDGKGDDNKGTLRWNEGEPATCSNYALAVFTCETCGEKVVFQLSGEHTFGTAANQTIVHAPKCLDGGWTERYCTSCEEWIVTDETDALGHDYGAWTIDGQSFITVAYEDGEYVILDAYIADCKSVCSRCDAELVADWYENQILNSIVWPTCGKDGKAIVIYYFENKIVDLHPDSDEPDFDEITIPMLADHVVASIYEAEKVIKWYDDGIWYLGYVCEYCGTMISVPEFCSDNEATVDGIIANLPKVKDYIEDLTGNH